MAAREIKTTIALDGEKEFKQAITDANREMRLMGAELKEIASEFDVTGNSQQYYTRRSETLKREMQQQRNIIAALEGAVKDLGEKHGEASKEVQSMTIELTNARTRLNRIQKEFNQNEKAARDFGKSLDKNVEDEAKQAGKAIKNLDKDLDGLDGDLGGIKGAIDGLKGLKGLDIGMDIFGSVPDWVSQVLEWGQEGRGYQRQQAELHYTTQWAGADEEAVREQINEVAAVTQDRGSAQAGVQMLINIDGIDEPMLETIVDNLMGADILMPELEFGQLAEGFQESASSGQLAGPFMELLERSGFESDEIEGINDELANLRTERERANLLLTKLAGIRGADGETGLVDVYRQYQQEQAPIIEAEKRHQELEEEWSELKSSELVQGTSQAVSEIPLLAADIWQGLRTGEMGTRVAPDIFTSEFMEDPAQATKEAAAETTKDMAWALFTKEGWMEGLNVVRSILGLDEMKVGPNMEFVALANETLRQSQRAGVGVGPNMEFVALANETLRQSQRAKENEMSVSLWEDVFGEDYSPAAALEEAESQAVLDAAEGIRKNYGTVMEKLGLDLGADLGAGIADGGKAAAAAMADVTENLADMVGNIVLPPIQIPVMASAGGYGGGNVYLDGRQVGKVMGPGMNRYLGRQS